LVGSNQQLIVRFAAQGTINLVYLEICEVHLTCLIIFKQYRLRLRLPLLVLRLF